MNGALIIVTGPPGSGKTSFAERIHMHFSDFTFLSYDTVKEDFFDMYGFNNLQEKDLLNARSLEEFYHVVDEKMQFQTKLLIEYPFCKKHEKELRGLVSRYKYPCVTVILSGSFDILYMRSINRDMTVKRHPGHLAKCYHKNKAVLPEDMISMVTLETFKDTCIKKNYNIRVGSSLIVDVNDYKEIDYNRIFLQIDAALYPRPA